MLATVVLGIVVDESGGTKRNRGQKTVPVGKPLKTDAGRSDGEVQGFAKSTYVVGTVVRPEKTGGDAPLINSCESRGKS